MRAIRLAVSAVLALTAASAGLASADELATWQQTVRDPQHKLWEQTVGARPDAGASKPPVPIDQLVLLSVENGNLVVRTPASSTPAPAAGKDDYCKQKVDGWNDWASIRISGGAGPDHKPVVPKSLEVNPTSFLDDQIRSIAASKITGQIALATTVQDVTGITNEEIGEQNDDDDFTHPHPCMLMILKFKPSRSNGQPPTIITFTEPDFRTLMQKHGDLLRKDYRPLFHQLNADFVFAIDPTVAWQVLPEAWQPDPKVADEVGKVLPQLATGTFQQRKDARKSLEDLGTPGALAILHLDRAKLTAEQNAQLDRIVQPYHQLSDEQAKSMHTDPQFLVDCLYCSDPLMRQAAIGQLRIITKLDLPFDPAADDSARNAAIAAIREKLVSGKFLADLP